MAMRKREDDEVYPNAAGIDVGASSHWVAVPRTADDQPVREFGTMTGDLNAMADWLLACGVDTVALESTGIYWIPVYEVLEQRGLTVWLVDARQMKYVPGSKSDVQDCQWLQKLMSLGLLRAAWRPAGEVCVIRAVVRQRELLLTEQGSWIQRMQKALGADEPSAHRGTLRCHGRDRPGDHPRHRRGRTRPESACPFPPQSRQGADRQLARGAPVRARAGAGDVRQPRPAHPRMRCEDRGVTRPARPAPRPADRPRQEAPEKHPRFDARAAPARWAGVDLTRINGLSVATVMTILSEIGPDLSRFASVKHFCSWLRLCPATKISGGKTLSSGTRPSANRARQALKMAAMSLSRSDSALGAFYRRLCARMDKPRANTAVAHKLARMVYFMLTRGETFLDQGQQRYEEQQRQRSIAALRRRASALGFQLQPNAQTP
ncbi:IS110 family RNA-guided transposase [Paraburkholderia franconis]|uniref:IS110 family transposase n=1 Tax=Paraburkholderia franconis TaxID=2654983 RepID=UPI002AB2C535|nr:IS110 family transposase [Paraburkholderia franconis]